MTATSTTYTVINPATEEAVAEVELADLARTDALIDAARAAAPGWRDVAESDLLLKPDLGSAFADPFSAQPTLVLFCDGAEPGTGLGYERDPRSVALRAEAFLRGRRYADEARVAVELAFFLFDGVKVELSPYDLSRGRIVYRYK